MHVIIAAIGTSGDTLPLIELGQHLMRSGHEVEFIGLAYFANRAQQAGLPFHSAGPTNLFEEMARDPTVWDWHVGFRSLWKVLGAAMADTFNTINQLRSSGTVGVRLAQEKFGLRAMTVHMSPFYFFSREQNCLGGLGAWPRWLPHLIRRAVLNVIDRFYIDGVCVNDVNALRRLIGLPPQRHIFTRWINSPDRIICAVPAWFANSQADWPVNAVSTGFPVALTPELWAPSASLLYRRWCRVHFFSARDCRSPNHQSTRDFSHAIPGSNPNAAACVRIPDRLRAVRQTISTCTRHHSQRWHRHYGARDACPLAANYCAVRVRPIF
jgi:hypothetical protein